MRFRAEGTGTGLVFPELRADSNLRTTLEKFIKRAGLKQWPKLWQNLRASAATDLARCLPGHVAAAICGHTEQIAQEHYRTVSNFDLQDALRAAPTIGAPRGAPIQGQNGALCGNSKKDASLPAERFDQGKPRKNALQAVSGNSEQIANDSRGGTRTRTRVSPHRILSPVCLPFHHSANSIAVYWSCTITAISFRAFKLNTNCFHVGVSVLSVANKCVLLCQVINSGQPQQTNGIGRIINWFSNERLLCTYLLTPRSLGLRYYTFLLPFG